MPHNVSPVPDSGGAHVPRPQFYSKKSYDQSTAERPQGRDAGTVLLYGVLALVVESLPPISCEAVDPAL